MTFEVPVVTKASNNSREHWAIRARRVKAEREATRVCFIEALRVFVRPNPPCTVRLTRLSPRLLDDGDNLPSAMKGIRDQVADELGLANDRDPRVTWLYAQEKRGKAEGPPAVKVQIIVPIGGNQ